MVGRKGNEGMEGERERDLLGWWWVMWTVGGKWGC